MKALAFSALFLAGSASALWHDPEVAAGLKASRQMAKQHARHQRHKKLPLEGESLYVAWVVDGDTLRLDDGDRVRLLGIDAPEMHNLDDPYDHSGQEARQCALQILGSQTISLRYGPRKRDAYGRILAWVILADGTNMDDELLRRGCAKKMRVF